MITTIFVADSDALEDGRLDAAISFDDYLQTYPRKGEGKVRIINLCNTDRYLSQGYYCSLLAEARHHSVVPSVRVINSLRGEGATLWVEGNEAVALRDAAPFITCMGEAEDATQRRIAARAFRSFPAPILHLTPVTETTGVRVRVRRANLSDLSSAEQDYCLSVFANVSQKHWQRSSKSRKHRWDLAILVDPTEPNPPSDEAALNRFMRAGKKLGIRAQTFTAADLPDLDLFDALFVRETTAIDHHTYRIAQEAENRGLVVIDDPDSILRCCNKVFLHDAFNYSHVSSLKTLMISSADAATEDRLVEELGLPFVLKMPEGSFSRGVFKIDTRETFRSVAGDLLKGSALLLAQEFLFTPFDWRIGVLNGRALYACRYYMARTHWQI